MKGIIQLILCLSISYAFGIESWCQSLVLRRAIKLYSFSYLYTIQDGQGNDLAATRCFVFLTEQEKQILRNTLNMVNGGTQLRSMTTVTDSLLGSFGKQIMQAKGENATVQDALAFIQPIEEGA